MAKRKQPNGPNGPNGPNSPNSKKAKSGESVLTYDNINVKMISPNIINATNFFMYLTYGDVVFYDKIYNYEKKIYLEKKKISNGLF